MAGMFKSPKMPAPPPPPLPMLQADDESMRRARLKHAGVLLASPSGRLADQMGQVQTADSTYTPAETRKGTLVRSKAGNALLTGTRSHAQAVAA